MGTPVARGVDVPKDFASGAALQITYAHSAAHRDIIARATRVVAAGTGIVNVLFKSPGPLQAHLEWLVVASADTEVRLYEAPTVTAEGDDMVRTRLYTPSSKTTQMVTKTGGTVDPKGTLLDEQWTVGTTGGQVRGGSVVHDGAEWLLKVDTWYLLEIDRKSSTKLSIIVEWHEEAEITI